MKCPNSCLSSSIFKFKVILKVTDITKLSVANLVTCSKPALVSLKPGLQHFIYIKRYTERKHFKIVWQHYWHQIWPLQFPLIYWPHAQNKKIKFNKEISLGDCDTPILIFENEWYPIERTIANNQIKVNLSTQMCTSLPPVHFSYSILLS